MGERGGGGGGGDGDNGGGRRGGDERTLACVALASGSTVPADDVDPPEELSFSFKASAARFFSRSLETGVRPSVGVIGGQWPQLFLHVSLIYSTFFSHSP